MTDILAGSPKPWQLLALGPLLAASAWWWLSRTGDVSKRRGVRRSMSFTSEAMLSGAFPAAAKMPDPVINAVLLFRTAPSDERLLEMARDMIAKFERFECPTVKVGSFMCWKEPEGEADLRRNHLFREQVQSDAELWLRIEALAPTQLRAMARSADSPIWEYVVLDNANGQSALLFRVHHSIADGISLVNLAQTILKDQDGNSLKIPLPFKRKDKNFGIKLSLFSQVAKSLYKCLVLGVSKYDTDLAFTGTDRPKMSFSGKRKVVLFPDIDENFVKALKNAANVSFNDIMFAAFAGMVRRYCERSDDPALRPAKDGATPPVQFRALLPVAFPRSQAESSDRTRAMRNKWCFVSAAMPVGTDNARDRVAQTNAEMNILKNSPTAPVQLFLQNKVLPHAPRFLGRQTVYDIFSRHSMVFSNVPGPKTPFYAAGEEVVGIQMVFPNLIPQVGILSYCGTVSSNISVDPDVVTQPALLRRCFVDEFRHLASSYNVPFPETITQGHVALDALGMD